MEMEASEPPHNSIYMDEAGFDPKAARNIIGHRAAVDVPGHRGGSITMVLVSENGELTHIPIIGPSNPEHLVTFLDSLSRAQTMSVSIAPVSSGTGLDPQQDAGEAPLLLLPIPEPH